MADEDRPDVVTQHIEAGRDREAARQALLDARNGGPMDPMTQLDELEGPLATVVANIRPDQLDNQTPCAGFTVRGVLEHMVVGATMFTAAFNGEAPGEPDTSDLLGAFEPVVLGDLFAAMRAPGAMEKTIAAPFGEVSGDTFARFVVFDGLVHGWDLARATGQPYEPPIELIAAADAFAHQAIDPLRDGDTFADAVEPSPDATPIERLAAYSGRTP